MCGHAPSPRPHALLASRYSTHARPGGAAPPPPPLRRAAPSPVRLRVSPARLVRETRRTQPRGACAASQVPDGDATDDISRADRGGRGRCGRAEIRGGGAGSPGRREDGQGIQSDLAGDGWRVDWRCRTVPGECHGLLGALCRVDIIACLSSRSMVSHPRNIFSYMYILRW